MAIVAGILSVLLFGLYLRERAAGRRKDREIGDIEERLRTLSDGKEGGYLLVFSDNDSVRALSAQVNRLLESFYRQREEYGRAKQAMEEMLTNIAHDLRTPLTVLKGYSEILQKETMRAECPPQLQERIAKIDRKADELVATINDYFTIARIESGDMRLERRPFDLTQLCHEVMLDYYDMLEEACYEVDIFVEPEPVYVCGDREAVRRILKNITDNAIKHGGAGKYLGIRLRRSGTEAVVEIEDHGPGIGSKDKELIFSRNYTTAGRRAGSGLGLAIAAKLAKHMGAGLQVESEPGMRTVFCLSLKEEMLEKS